MDLEPNNSYPIDEVWYYFQEDILQATYNDYLIDLGFYGDYSNNRKGFFKLIVTKGDFSEGELFEKYISRSTEEIKKKLEFYFNFILSNEIERVSGLKYGKNKNQLEYDIYSSINKIKIKLTDEDFEKLLVL